jgi:drug/metabolite transporter (DMT)-like permease
VNSAGDPGATQARGTLLALLSALAFSTLAIWGKLASASGLATYTLLPFRFGIVALVLLMVAGRGYGLRDRAILLGTGLLYTLATACYFGALSRISASATGLLLYLAPGFVILYAWLLGRAPSRAQVTAVLLTLLGLMLILGVPSRGDASPLGLALGVLTGGLYGAYLLASERWLAPYPPLASTAHMTLVAALSFACAGAATGTLGIPHGLRQWGVTLGMAIFPTFIAVPALYGAIARLGAARASVLSTTEPVWTVLLSLLILGEPARPSVLVGGALILLGAVLAQGLPKRLENPSR